MGAGNPFFRYYNGEETYEVSTYFVEYFDGNKPNGKPYKNPGGFKYAEASRDAFEYIMEDLQNLAEEAGMEQTDQTERDSESCAGFRDEATVLAHGKYSKLLAMDTDGHRLCFSVVPAKDYDTFAQEIRDDHYYRKSRWSEESVDADIARRWPVYEQRYAKEFIRFMRNVHKNYPGEHTLYSRNGPWMSSALPAYDKKQPWGFYP